MKKIISQSKAWKIRVDVHDKSQMAMLHKGEVVIDYSIPNLSSNFDKQELIEFIKPHYSSSSSKRLKAHAGQLFSALTQIHSEDLIIVPIDRGHFFHIGKVKFDMPNIHGTRISRKVEWLRENIPLSLFDQDLQYSFMAIMKLCEVKRNNAFRRLSEIANGESDPGF